MNKMEQRIQGFLMMGQWKGMKPSFELPEVGELRLEKIEEKDRLGLTTEAYFAELIQASKRYDLLAQNVQIVKDKRTLGELDFLLFDREKEQVKHVELVTKFYLYDPSAEEEEYWIGPNRKDNWALKKAKLQDNQFPLLYTEEAKAKLSALGYATDEVVQELCFKVQCFVPEGAGSASFPELTVGTYESHATFLGRDHAENTYCVPQKLDWLCEPNADCNWEPFDEIEADLNEALKHERSPLVWIKTGEQIQRVFVTFW